MNLSSEITNVTVYADRARVVRTGTANLEKGRHTVILSGLPASLDTNSIRVSARGARIVSFDVESITYTEPPSVPVTELEAKVEDLRDRMSLVDRRIALETERAAHFEGIALQAQSLARGLAMGRLTVSNLLSIEETIANEKQASSERSVGLAKEKRQLTRELARLEQDLKNAGSAARRVRVEVRLDVESAGGEASFTAACIIPGPSWKPRYDFRFGEKVMIQYLGEISQNTGEPWTDVELSLSTAPASSTSTPPSFFDWHLMEAPPPRPVPPMQVRAPAPAPGFAAAAAMPPEEEIDGLLMASFDAAPDASGTSITYTLPSRVTIPGNGEEKKANIASGLEFARELDFLLLPAISQHVYRRAAFTNESAYLFLQGSGQVFFEDEYIGETTIEETPPGQKREIFLGVESRITVKRERKLHETDKKMLGDTRRIRSRFEIQVENHLAETANLALREQIPVSKHESIKVKLETPDLKPEQPEPGILEWKFPLQPNAKRTIIYDLIIEHPQSMTVVGLP